MKNVYYLDSIIKKKINKIYILLFSMLIFSFLYMLLSDNDFEGVNKYKEIVKEEVIKNKVQKEIVENFIGLENYKNNLIEEKIIDKSTKETENIIIIMIYRQQ
tara:strand:+ start:1405 stop:1713 length:309 start_codon:yes stop_codon:yes gene_type:complete